MHDDIWVVTELVGKGLASVSLQLLGKARQLADQADGKVMAVAMGHQIMPLAQEIVEHGADEVLVADHPELAYYRTLPYARVLTELVQERKPNVVLLGATSQGRDLAPESPRGYKQGSQPIAWSCILTTRDSWYKLSLLMVTM